MVGNQINRVGGRLHANHPSFFQCAPFSVPRRIHSPGGAFIVVVVCQMMIGRTMDWDDESGDLLKVSGTQI